MTRIAIASCCRGHSFDEQPVWADIEAEKPDLLLLLGDQVYMNNKVWRHWELDKSGQPTNQILERRRRAEFITPIPKPKKRRGVPDTQEILFSDEHGLSTEQQQYDPTGNINELRRPFFCQMEAVETVI